MDIREPLSIVTLLLSGLGVSRGDAGFLGIIFLINDGEEGVLDFDVSELSDPWVDPLLGLGGSFGRLRRVKVDEPGLVGR